jgi:hypothetical protein
VLGLLISDLVLVLFHREDVLVEVLLHLFVGKVDADRERQTIHRDETGLTRTKIARIG